MRSVDCFCELSNCQRKLFVFILFTSLNLFLNLISNVFLYLIILSIVGNIIYFYKIYFSIVLKLKIKHNNYPW